MAENHKPEKTAKNTHKAPKKDNQVRSVVLLVLLLVVVAVVVALVNSNNSDKSESSKSSNSGSTQGASQTGKLYLKQSSQSVNTGDSLTYEVWVDTGGQPVNAVQANLTYPADMLDFSNIDAKGSAFEVQAMSTGGDGKVSIARGHIGEVKNKALVAKITFVAKAKGSAKINFAQGSALVSSSSHTDILKEKTGSTLIIN
jgi:hypothetical protein